MKTFLKQILLFFLIFFIVEKSVWFLLDTAPKREYDNRLEQVLKGEMNKELIIIGSSRSEGNILAGQLQKETGLSAYNLGYRGANIIFHEFILKTLLKYNKPPKHILLNIDSPSTFLETNSITFRTDVLLPLVNYNYINTKLITFKINNKMSNLFLSLRLNSNHFNFSRKQARLNSPMDSSGSKPLINNKKVGLKYKESFPDYNKSLEQVAKLSALKEIQDICEYNNIRLSYIISPNFETFNHKFYKRFKALKRKEENIFVYDTLNPIYQDEAYFFDDAHLLKNGAQIFTSEISEFIKSLLH